MNRGRPIAFLLVLSFFSACKKEPSPLFKLIKPAESNIHFNNLVEESDTLNILENQYLYNGGGVGLGDFNNDGLLDIFFAGNEVPNKLYLNKGNLHFEDVTEKAGVGAPETWSSGVALVDINTDGLLDIYISATFKKDAGQRRNNLFVNLGNDEKGAPRFEEKASQFGIADTGHSTQSVFFDYDLDGDLDLYVLTDILLKRRAGKLEKRILDGSSPTTDRLYRNNGDGTFTNVSAEAGILDEGFGLGIAVLDVNKDNYPDLYISNDFVINDVLYINNGDGSFTNRIADYLKHQSYASMGNDAADINHDGLVDIMTLDMLPPNNQREKQMFGANRNQFHELMEKKNYEQQYTRNCLQLNNGRGFSDISQVVGLDRTDWSWSVLFADYDNDGQKDIAITNGFPRDLTDHDFAEFRVSRKSMFATTKELLSLIPVVKIRNYFFKNKGNLQFEDVSEKWGVHLNSFSNGAAFGDLDNDGDLDYVVNNTDDEAFLFENKARQQFPENNYLRIRLKGSSNNPKGLDAKISLKYNGVLDYYENSPYRGYVSTVEPCIHFGLGKVQMVDTVMVQWPDGRSQILTQVPVNQVLEVDYKNSVAPFENANSRQTVESKKLFQEATDDLKLHFKHSDPKFSDFRIQVLLPHKFSQEGPGLTVGDINGDGLEDIFVGNGKGNSGVFFLQNENGTFDSLSLNDPSDKEDLGVLLFDADQDGDLDLYLVSGSSEFLAHSENYKDRLFLNDGAGNFKFDSTALPAIKIAGSTVDAADFDRDGDLDLFVGGRLIPQNYPLPERSVLLRNDGGKFSDATRNLCPELKKGGLVTDAIWTDFDGDGWVDLMVVGEWVPIQFFKNENGKFVNVTESVGLKNTEGWWNSILAGDFDQDGDLDYVLGNQGLNNKYHASAEHPVRVFAKDFDDNGSVDNFIFAFREGDYYPVHLRNDVIKQLNYMGKKFPKYTDYSAAKMSDLFSKEELADAWKGVAHIFESVYLENSGDGKFRLKPLPIEAQFAPVFGMLSDDYNGDGNLDILMVGNDYGTEVFTGRHDAFTGLLLEGDGQGGFSPAPLGQTDFHVDGDAKSLVQLFDNQGNKMVIAAQNRAVLKAFRVEEKMRNRKIIQAESLDFKALIFYKDGAKSINELHYGTSYLSASSRNFVLDASKVEKVILKKFSGEERTVELLETN